MRVMIVDDEPAVRQALEMALNDGQRQIEAVDSGAAALRRLDEVQFDLVLIDKNMPGMSGVDLMRAIRKTNPSIGLIMLTGYPSPESAAEALQIGVDGYIEKPFTNVFDVVRRVEAVVDGRAAGKPSASSARVHFRKAREMLQRLESEPPPVSGLKVIVLATIAGERSLLQAELERRAEVATVETPEEIVASARLRPPGLVIADLLPGIETALRQLRDLAPEAPIVVMIEKAPSVQRISDLIELGVVSMINKPFDAAQLRMKLASIPGPEKAQR